MFATEQKPPGPPVILTGDMPTELMGGCSPDCGEEGRDLALEKLRLSFVAPTLILRLTQPRFHFN